MATSKEIGTGYQFLHETRTADRLYGFFHDARLQPNLATTATYESRTGGLLTRELVEPALRQLVRENPRLGTSLVRARASAGGAWEHRAVRLDGVDLDACLVFEDDAAVGVDEVMGREAMFVFPSTPAAPHWRVVVLQGRHVVLCFNHIGLDGISTLAFHRRLLSLLNGGPATDEGAEDGEDSEGAGGAGGAGRPAGDDPRAVPNLAAFERDVSWPRMLVDVVHELARNTWARWRYRGRRQVLSDARHGRYARRTGGEVDAPDGDGDGARLRYATVRLPAATMRLLLAACRRHEASFTAALHAAVMAVLAGHLYPQAVFARSRIAVSYRRFTGTADDAITDEVGHVYWGRRFRRRSADDPLALAALWASAGQYTRHVSDDLAQVRRHARANCYRRLMGRSDAQISRSVGLMGAQRHGTVEMSNLGVFVPSTAPAASDSSPGWAITDVSFRVATAHHSVGCSLTLGVISLMGGDCVVNISYDTHVFPDQKAMLFQQKLNETLVRMAGSDKE